MGESSRCARAGAHGGFVVARHEGVVVFVRHALPGERVVAEVTEGAEGDRFLRADAVEVLDASPDRVAPPCPYARPGRCGGCDFQHVDLPAQRRTQGRGRRGAAPAAGRHRTWRSTSRRCPATPAGLGWRTRVQWAVDGSTVAPGCASTARTTSSRRPLPDRRTRACRRCSTRSGTTLSRRGDGVHAREQLGWSPCATARRSRDGPDGCTSGAAGADWQVTGSGFWQVHPGAADTLVAPCCRALAPRPGESVASTCTPVSGCSRARWPRRSARRVRWSRSSRTSVAAGDAVANLADLPQVEP